MSEPIGNDPNFDGQGKSYDEEVHGGMVAVVYALGASLLFAAIVGGAVWWWLS